MLTHRFNVLDLFAWGADPNTKDKDDGEPPRIDPPSSPPQIKKKPQSKSGGQDDEDEEDEYINDPRDRRIRRLTRERDRSRKREAELEQENEQLQGQVDELTKTAENAVKLQAKYDKLKEGMEKSEEEYRQQAIRTAISSDKERAWYDEGMIVSLLDREKLAVNLADGSVGGLDDQLKEIAEKKPFLVKEVKSGDNGQPPNQQQQQQQTGFPPQSSAGGTREQNAANSEREMLEAFPALRNVMK